MLVAAAGNAASAASSSNLSATEFAISCSLSLSLSVLLAVRGTHGALFQAACGNVLSLLSQSSLRDSAVFVTQQVSLVRKFCGDLYREGSDGAFVAMSLSIATWARYPTSDAVTRAAHSRECFSFVLMCANQTCREGWWCRWCGR